MRCHSLFWLANAGALIALLGWFGGHRALGELAVGHSGRDAISITAGDGWYELERLGRSSWLWAKGPAALRMHVKAGEGRAPIMLRFGLRSLAPKKITIAHAGRIVWEGEIGTSLRRVEIAGLWLPDGISSLDFTAYADGQTESLALGGRTLAFALYDLRLSVR